MDHNSTRPAGQIPAGFSLTIKRRSAISNSHRHVVGATYELCPMFPNDITDSPHSVLWHFATGYLPDFLNKRSGRACWMRWPHRGVQFLDKFEIPRKHKKSIHSPEFELRVNTAFEEVVRATADTQRRYIQLHAGQTWITPELISALIALRKTGHAHSFETWKNNQLVGGIWGIQLGGLITMSSMFTRVSNAARCSMARTMLQLKARGFTMVDMGMVPEHRVHFGAEWIPRWKYESMLPGLIRGKPSIHDDHPCPPLPWPIRVCEPLLRLWRGVSSRVILLKAIQSTVNEESGIRLCDCRVSGSCSG
jgi:leucyl/phenylalanyl-tRNA--protein transferase